MSQLFFVGGPSKSGTTWLRDLLDLHPEISCKGESHVTTMLWLPLMEVVKRYNGFLELITEEQADSTQDFLPIQGGELRDLLASTYLRRLDTVGHGGAGFIGEKTPAHADSVHLIFKVFPDTRYIGLTRDPRTFLVSRIHHDARFDRLSGGRDATAIAADLNYVTRWAGIWKRRMHFFEEVRR
ncbi:MAG: sulfotransferase, partial [Myxococcota bacterium]|nr:sulfotransferase [Myxococcota bacterium]